MLIWTGFSFTRKEKVLDLGKVEINKNSTENVNWSPYAGALIIVAGVIFIVIGRKEKG